ncbi:MAG: DUF1416 domain-containing protein [Actinobacteria bacterium]|nr:DUF1416 domain-containing protein [Actinomycetota bacterium]NBY15731.1 DUF1416 domain-containing protein [Actinomycetota bacterium]
MSSCGAVVGGVSLDHVDVTKQAVIQGVISTTTGPVATGYARLNDRNGDFVAEVPLSARGEFRFFAAPGLWTVVALVPGGTSRTEVKAELGQIADLDITI